MSEIVQEALLSKSFTHSNQCSFVLQFSSWAKEEFISSQTENLPHQHPVYVKSKGCTVSELQSTTGTQKTRQWQDDSSDAVCGRNNKAEISKKALQVELQRL